MRYRAVVLLCLICLMLSGCGSGSVSFQDAYDSEKQQEFNEKADRVKDAVTSEADRAKQAVEEREEQIRSEAGKTSGQIDQKSRGEFEEGLDKLDEWSNTGMSTSQLAWYYVLKCYYFIREISPALIAVSMFCGLILYLISFGNKGKQKFAVFGLGISVPVVLLLIRFVVPWMFTLFGY